MSVEQHPRWLTGTEIGEERRRLLQAGVPSTAPEFERLWEQVDERDDWLFERYGKPLLASHPGKWVAIGMDGQVIIRETASEVGAAAVEAFGRGNYCKRRLADPPGHKLGLRQHV
jgi:hypothetical protein